MKGKKILKLMAAIITISCIIPSASALAADTPRHDFVSIQGTNSTAVIQAEQTEWYYRNNNGIMEKRLWSITYGIWLTDWMPV